MAAKFLQGFSTALALGGLIAWLLSIGWRCGVRGEVVGLVLYSVGIYLLKGGNEWTRR